MPSAAPDLSPSQNNPASPLATPFFSQRDPFQPSTRCLSLRGTVADFDQPANQRPGPDHERYSADCTIDGLDELTSHRRAIIACLCLSWPRLRHRSASFTHPRPSQYCQAGTIRAMSCIRFVLDPAPSLAALGRPGGPHYSCWNVVSKSAWPVSALPPGASRSSHGDHGPILE